MKTSLYDEEIPKQLEFMDKLLQQNNGGKGYLVGNKVCDTILPSLISLYF